MPTRLTVRLDFDDGRRLGAGKIALLEAIDTTGSISAAGRRARDVLSPRLAAGRRTEPAVSRAPLVAAHHGGAKGGGAALTEEGRRIVALYRGAEARMRAAAEAEIAESGGGRACGRADPEGGPGARPPRSSHFFPSAPNCLR